MKIALLSDTHRPWFDPTLPARAVDLLKWVDAILHAGDLVCVNLLDDLQKISDTYAVYGNQDEPDVVKQLPFKQTVLLGGIKIGLIHGHTPGPNKGYYRNLPGGYESPEFEPYYDFLMEELPEANVIVFGHFHKPLVRRHKNRLFINPGTMATEAGQRTFAFLDTDTYDQPNPQVEFVKL